VQLKKLMRKFKDQQDELKDAQSAAEADKEECVPVRR
jgi:hypothetical protein